MKQFTFSAQVANNLLTVLQGYSKTIRLLLVMFLTLTVSANAWGADVTISVSSDTWTNTGTSGSGSLTKVSKSGVTVSSNKGFKDGTTAIREYSGGIITVSSSSNITKIVFTSTSSGTSNNGPSKISINSGGGNYSYSGSDGTWTGTSSTVTFKCNAQFRWKQVVVTTASSHTVTWTINPAAGGTLSATSGNSTTVSPNAAYTYGAPAYTVTSGAATVSQSGNTFTATPTANSTIQINMVEKSKCTVTLNAGPGTCAASVTEASAGAGVTLPTPTLDCGDWEFAGWKTTSAVTTETTTEPTLIPAGAYSPTSDITLYAVYQRTETTSGGGGGGSSTPITTDDIFENGGTYTAANGDVKAYITWTEANVVSIKQEQGSSTSAVNSSYVKDPRWYKSHNITITPTANIAYITVTAQSNEYATELANSTYTNAEASANNSTVTITPTDGNENITISMGAQARLSTLTVTYTSGGGSSSTTYYHSTPDCGSTASTYTLTLDSDLSCVTDGSATVELNATELTNFIAATRDGFTCSGYWSAPSGGVKVLNADGTFAATSVQDYITDGKWTNEGNVTLTPRWECSNTMTLSVGTQSGGTYSLSKTSLETCDCTDTKRQVTITATPNSGYSVTDISYSGNGTATKVSGPTVNGNNTEWVYQFDQGDNGNGTFTVTFTTIPAYTITLDAGSGTCDDESLTETSGGAGVTLPTANPPAACATDGWEFAGWWTASVAGTTTSPGELLTAGSNYKPASDCTLYAVYSHTEAGGGGGSQTVTLTNDDIDAAYVGSGDNPTTSYGNHTIVSASGTWGGRITIGNQSGVKYVGISANDDNRHLASPIFSANITNITIKGRHNASSKTRNIYICSSNTTAKPTSGEIGSGSIAPSGVLNQFTNWTDVSIPVSGDYKNFYVYADGGLQIYSIVVTTSGGSTTTYNSNPVCVASWSITYDFAGGTGSHCSNTSVPQGDTYTICDEAPTKEGYTFQGWSDGINIHQPNNKFTPTSDITLTAQWQINTYTVIWSVNGATTEVTYEHGQALSEKQPADPTSAACDGEKEFVGWTANDEFTYHATTPPSDLFKTTTATVTADKTYYAVFATKGAGGTEFVLGESGTFKMYANVNGTNYYAQGGVSDSKLGSTTNVLSASDYTLTHKGYNKYTIQLGSSNIGHTASSSTNLSTGETIWTISTGTNGSWRITSPVNESRALAYRASTYNIFKAYSMTNVEAGDTEYFDIEFGSGSDAHSDYTTICQTVESIEIANYTTEFFVTDEFAFGGTVTAHFDEGEPQDVTAFAHFSGYNMEATGTQTVTVTYMGATATYEITVKPLDNAWVLTWNVSGKTNTGLGPRSVTKDSAIGTLPTPAVPAACAGKTFMGWTESNIVPSDGKGIVYITEATVPSKNTTYYAVFATINNFSTQAAIEDIADSSKVVIVAVASMDASGGAGQAISSRTISITSQGVIGLSGDEVSIFDETINTPHSTCIWTLTKEGGGIVLEQDGNYIRAVNDDGYRKLLLETTKDYWTLSPVDGKDKTYHMQSGNTSHYVEWFDHTDSKYDEGERYIGFVPYTEANDNGDFDMQFYVTANKDGDADITDYTTGCAEYTITYYGFHGGYSTSCSSDGTIVLPVNSLHTVPNCGDVVTDHTNLGREFLNVWMTQPHGGHTFKPGDTFILTQDTTLYAQWKMETTSDVTTLPTDIEDLAGTDIYVYGGTTLNIQPGTTTINSLTLKGGLQADGSYKMPTVWVPEGATLVRNSNKINLDLIVNAKTYYPFAVPFAAKNNENVEYLDSVLAAASHYGTHFAIKTYDGARRAKVGEDKANNWVRVLRDSTLQPGVGYIITALTRPDKDTATIRIPMTVLNTWFQNGEQAEVGTTVRNTIAVTAHGGTAANEHQRHAGWNFVANPYLTSFAGGNVDNDGDLAYINGELIIEGSYVYGGDPVPYVTVPAYDFAYYSQHKLSEVKLSPEWSFFVQVGTGGTMNFTTAGRQQAPASIAARNAEERPVKMDVDLILSDNHSSDQTGLIICDRYTDAYEIGRDLEKLFGSAYNLSVYTLMEDNTPLAFQALAIRSSMQVIPVGYRAPEQGEYTFRLNEATSSIDLLNEQYEQLVLVDYQTGELTNLLYTDYTFYSERTQSNSRFAIYAVPRQNAPTDLPNAIGSDEEVRKVIYNDHLYILRDGNVYNGMGQKM